MPLSSPNGCCVRFLLVVELQRPEGQTDVPSTQWPPPLRDFLFQGPLPSRDFRLQWPLLGQLSFFVNIFIIFSIVLCLNSFLLSPYSAKLESVPHHLAKSSMQLLIFFFFALLSQPQQKQEGPIGWLATGPTAEQWVCGFNTQSAVHERVQNKFHPIPALVCPGFEVLY